MVTKPLAEHLQANFNHWNQIPMHLWLEDDRSPLSKDRLHCLGNIVVYERIKDKLKQEDCARRFEKMVKAAEAGYVNAPVDLRYISKPMSKNPSEATASVASFLSSMYQSVAETLPDIRDEACDFEIETTLAAPEDETDKVDLARKPELGGLHEERYLPPGSLKEIWEQYKVLNTPAASFVTFYRVAG
ncbi:unnamed protein product [Durusdinium trenchii]|uniref:Uncharacterized protein n=1 Tax=Durusdinium trenchii TaxID=1381693 RepID=A0ABP0NRL5_9DINO